MRILMARRCNGNKMAQLRQKRGGVMSGDAANDQSTKKKPPRVPTRHLVQFSAATRSGFGNPI